MPLFVAASIIGGLNGAIFSASRYKIIHIIYSFNWQLYMFMVSVCCRLFFVAARNGHLPQLLSFINIKYFSPTPSLIFLVSCVPMYFLCEVLVRAFDLRFKCSVVAVYSVAVDVVIERPLHAPQLHNFC